MKEKEDELTESIIEALQDKKGKRIVVADMSGIAESVCDKFVICTGSSPSQVQALAENVSEEIRKRFDIRPLAVAGMQQSLWVAMDYADVMVHVLLPEEREFYDIEHLWSDARLVEIPDLD